MNSLSIIATSDGSHTIQNETTGDTYHSIHGAVQESNHVFIQNGLHHFLEQTKANKISILEVGFGTGLNALLTLQAAEKLNVKVNYVAVDTFPLPENLARGLNYSDIDSRFMLLHEAKWWNPTYITPNFLLSKVNSPVEAHDFINASHDIVYFDAFAPSSQPELWTLHLFKKIKFAMAITSVLVTYCAKGQVKRDLKSAGFTVESIPGPPGKREMVRASA